MFLKVLIFLFHIFKAFLDINIKIKFLKIKKFHLNIFTSNFFFFK